MIQVMREPVQSEVTFRGRLFSIEVLRHQDRAGRDVTREVIRHPGAVAILPILDDDRLVLIRNYRVAVDDRLWEAPAGKLEPGEPPGLAARRELREETGYEAESMTPLGNFFTSPGFADERMHAFLARGLKQVGQALEPGEDIDVADFSVEEVLTMARSGEICDGKTLGILLLWRLSDLADGS